MSIVLLLSCLTGIYLAWAGPVLTCQSPECVPHVRHGLCCRVPRHGNECIVMLRLLAHHVQVLPDNELTVCMYVRMYVCMYVCMCVCVCMYVCMYVCVYDHVYCPGAQLRASRQSSVDSSSSCQDMAAGLN